MADRKKRTIATIFIALCLLTLKFQIFPERTFFHFNEETKKTPSDSTVSLGLKKYLRQCQENKRIPLLDYSASSSVNSVGGTTGSAVPELIRTFLSSSGISPIEDTDTTYGADLPVKAMEVRQAEMIFSNL